jgi:hypothetical protein
VQWRIETQFEPERIRNPRRRHRLGFIAAGLAWNWPRVGLASVVAEDDVHADLRRRRARHARRHLLAVVLKPLVDRRALRGRHTHQIAAWQNCRAARHFDLRLDVRPLPHGDPQTVDRAVAEAIARHPARPARMPGKILIEVLGTQDHAERVLDVFGWIGRDHFWRRSCFAWARHNCLVPVIRVET